MYILFGALFTLCLLCFFVTFFRREFIINKIKCMNFWEKFCLLNKLTKPFGFSYLSKPDVITSRRDAWQKNFGYRTLYDETAPQFNMVFDCEPVYFNYGNCTWLIEFWKGQYGITVGAEVGIYKAHKILSPDQYKRTLFYQISEDEMLPFHIKLNYKDRTLFSLDRVHWWLTGFRVGEYLKPEDLSMEIAITFPDDEMLWSFVDSLINLGYDVCDLCICDLTVAFCFTTPISIQPRLKHGFRSMISQWQNYIFNKLYKLVTLPFTSTMDRILYLYFFLPAAFRHLLLFKRNHKQKFGKKDYSKS